MYHPTEQMNHNEAEDEHENTAQYYENASEGNAAIEEQARQCQGDTVHGCPGRQLDSSLNGQKRLDAI